MHTPDDNELTAGFGTWPIDESVTKAGIFDGQPNSLNDLHNVFCRARAAGAEFRTRVGALRENGDLTPQGIARQVTEFASAAVKTLDTFAADQIGRARYERERLEGKVAALLKPEDGGAGDIFLRQELMALSEPERVAVLHQAVADGETAVLRAVFAAPKFLQRRLMTTPALLDGVRTRWLEARAPALTERLAHLEQGLAVADRARSALRNFIVNTKGIDPELRTALQAALFEAPTA